MPFIQSATTYSSVVALKKKGGKKRPKYTSVDDNSSNKTLKIENPQTDVPWCTD